MRKLFFICCLLSATPALSQTTGIIARPVPTGRVQWSDFTGTTDSGSPYWAHTEWQVKYTYKYRPVSPRSDTVKLDMDVQPLLKSNSWVLPDRQADELLLHEQGHFDFALLLAARFKKAATSTVFTRADHAQKLKELFTQTLADVKLLETQYDSETNHMRNKAAQLAWNKKLAELSKAAE